MFRILFNFRHTLRFAALTRMLTPYTNSTTSPYFMGIPTDRKSMIHRGIMLLTSGESIPDDFLELEEAYDN